MTWRRHPAVLWRRTPAHVVAVRPPATEPQIISGAALELWDAMGTSAGLAALPTASGTDPERVLRGLAAAGLVWDDPDRGPDPHPGSAPAAAAGPPTAERGTSDGSTPPPSHDLLVGALTFWLPGGPDPVATEPPSALQWQAVMDRARRERSFGPLCWAVGSGALASTEDQRDEAERYALSGAHHALQQEAELLEVHERLAAAGLEVRVLKGLAVAHLDHLDPSFRASADLDLLVRPDAVAEACAVLEAAGYRRELPERRAGFDARFGKDITYQASGRYEIDLHRLPLAGPAGWCLDLDALWSGSATFTVGGTELCALDAAGRFAHAAWSLALTDPAPRLVPALDMVAISHAHTVERDRLDRLVPTALGRAAIDDAIRLASTLLGPVADRLLPAVSSAAPLGRVDRALLSTYPGNGGSKASCLVAAAVPMRGWRDRSRYLAALVRPSRSYRRARQAQVRQPEWRLALGAMARRLRRRGTRASP